jgi:hypothetical protein
VGATPIVYRLEYKLNSATKWTTLSSSISGTSTSIGSGLSNGLLYNWRVTAICNGRAGTAVVGTNFTPTSTPAPLVNTNNDPIVRSSGLDIQLSVKAYPNPTSGKFILSMSGFEDGQILIKMTDAYGALVFNREQYLKRGFGITEVDLGQNKASGIYFIQVMQKDKVKVLKLMKN